jgi:protein-disulfide isomerase
VDARRFASAVDADLEQAAALGVFSTPTLFVNGRRIEGLVTVEDLRRVVEDALKASR